MPPADWQVLELPVCAAAVVAARIGSAAATRICRFVRIFIAFSFGSGPPCRRRLPPDVKVIPGHGRVSTLADVRACIKMMNETLAVVEQGVKQGRTLEQLKEEKVLEPWKSWSWEMTSDVYLETLYNDLTGKSEALGKPQ